MVKKVIAIGGEPATGKSTLVRELMKDYTLSQFKYGLVRGKYDELQNVYFIGVFDGDTFEGTDKLSMGVQPDFVKFLKYCNGIVIFEGDRLFNNKLFSNDFPFIKIVLTASNDTKDRRHKERGDNQSQVFLSSRITKIDNIIKSHPDTIILQNEDSDITINKIKEYIR